MPLDLIALAASFQKWASHVPGWSSKAVTIAAAATRLHAAYLRLEPSARTALIADEQLAISAWLSLDNALDAYNKASKLSKLSAVFAVADTIAKTMPLVTRLARDGETLFVADLTVIKPDVELILHTLQGSKA